MNKITKFLVTIVYEDDIFDGKCFLKFSRDWKIKVAEVKPDNERE